MELEQPTYIAIQPYNRTSQFFNLADFRMKEVLENHYRTIEKHSQKMQIETIFSLGMGPTEYVQIVHFKAGDLILFHEFMNDLTKVNSPFMNSEETVTGISSSSKSKLADKKRLMSILYLSHTPSWWILPDDEHNNIINAQNDLQKKYEQDVDISTADLLGMSSPEYVTIFEYQTENTPIYNRLINETMKIASPYLEINQTFTGIAGIGDYWLEQLKDIEIKSVPMSEFSKSRWGYKA